MSHARILLSLVLLCCLCSCLATTYVLRISAYYPKSLNQNLYIRGNTLGLNWNKGVQMTHVDVQLWQLNLTFTDSDIGTNFQFKALVGDQTWGIGSNSIVIIPHTSANVNVYPWFYSNAGVYQYMRNVYSPQLKNTRDLVIYTPPSYYENTLKWQNNVLIMQDGQNLFNASTSFAGTAWDCQTTVNELVNEGRMEEIVIIGVDNTPDRINEYTYSYDPSVGAGGDGNIYLDFLEQTVLPLVQQNFRIVPAPATNLGILGSSLGALISCYAGWTRSVTYGKAGCMSTSFWWNNQDFNNTILVQNPKPTNEIIYLDSGDAGPSLDDVVQTRTVFRHMEFLGMQLNSTLFYYLDKGGQHNEYYWGQRFWVPMTELYPPVPSSTSIMIAV